MRRPVKYFVSITVSLIVLAVFFAFGLPAILKSVLESQIQKNIHRQASIESISFNPFKLCLTVRGLKIREPASEAVFVSFDQLRVNAEIVSIFEGGIDLSEVFLENPSFYLVRTAANTYNFSDLITETEEKPDAQPSEPLLFSVSNIKITGGSIAFDDQPQKAIHKVSDLELNLPLISNFKQQVDVFVQPMFSAAINGRSFKLTGQTKPFADSLETSVEIKIKDLDLAKYLPYVPAKLNFKMPSGSLSTNLVLSYLQQARKAAQIKVQGGLRLAALEIVSPKGKSILQLPALAVSGVNCRVNEQSLFIDDISVEGLNLSLSREKDGGISLQKLVDTDNQTEAESQEPEDAPAWAVQVKNLKVSKGAVLFDDLFPAQPAQFCLDPIDLTLGNISTEKDSRGEIDLQSRLNGDSPISLTGEFSLIPLTVSLKADIADLDVRTAQSYLPETLLLDLTSGILGLNGEMDFKQVKGSDPEINWQGDIRLMNFAASRRGNKEDLVKLSSLDLKSMRVGTSPLSLDIKTVKLFELFMQPVVGPDGKLNFTDLNAASDELPPDSASLDNETLPEVNIGSIIIEKGRVLFVDKSIEPRYSTELSGIQGSVSDLSTKPDVQATVLLGASLNRYAPFKVSGTIKPLQEKLDADIKVLFNDIDLSPFSPYSGKYIGRLVEKGSLSVDLAYAIQDNQLTSQNKVLVDQLTLGKSVKSPDATSLPVGLAVSLLKDRKGRIELDLPVSGSLDDPSFKVGKVILQILVNLIQKAATSPFALMGKLIPGGVDISRIVFPCGKGSLNDEIIKKLDVLAGILAEKTDLTLEIQAVAVTALDRECLREASVMHKVRLQKYFDLSGKERKDLSPGEMVISEEKYDKYLRKAYKAEKFQKPKGMLGLNKRLPAAEMKALMLENTVIDDADLKDLLHQRGLAVKQYLVEKHNIPAERLFILDSRFDSGDAPSDSCVEFDLK